MSDVRDGKPKPPTLEMPLHSLEGPMPGEPYLGPRDRTLLLMHRVSDSVELGEKEEATRALHELVAYMYTKRSQPDSHSHLAETEARQGTYLAATGTLTQFNGIVAAALATALATLELGLLKYAVGAALVLHVLAGFALCWAAKPVEQRRETSPSPAMALMGQIAHVDHTFRNYQRGWRLTMLALTATSVAGALFLVRYLGVDLAGLSAKLFS